MGVKPGYKETEVGLIPQDWDIKPLGAFMSYISYGFTNPMPTSESGIPVITAKDVSNGQIHLETARVTTEQAYRELLTDKSRPKTNDLLLTKDGTLGRLALVGNTTICITQSVAILRPKLSEVPRFLKVLLEGHRYQARMIEDAGGSTIKHIYITIVDKMPIAIPPTKAEQEAIAGALGDADAFIEALERLLVKKRQLKHGTMQELLTGKQRLPGFSGEWVEKRLGEVGEISGAGVDKKLSPDEVAVRLINYLDVYRKGFLYSDDLTQSVTAKPEQAHRCAVQQGDVFFTPSSEVRNDIGHSAVAMETIADGAYSYHVVRLRLREDWDLKFRSYIFKTKAFLDLASMLCEGSGTRYVITLPKFRSMTVLVPPILSEQKAIAEILSDMDTEIAALETKLTKARQVKQGMMQELLTGRIRLV